MGTQPPPYDDNQPPVALAGPVGFAPQQPMYPQQQQQMYPPQMYQQQIYPQQDQQMYQPQTIVIQQNRRNRWYNPTALGPPGTIPPKSIYSSPLTWSIINAILFFPFILLWGTALYFSLKTRDAYRTENYQVAAQKSTTANKINMACTILGYN